MNKDEIARHFNTIAPKYDEWKKRNSYYYDCLKNFFRENTQETDNVVDIGCGTGSILAAVRGKHKLGVDISENMIRIARNKFPEIEFRVHDCETPLAEKHTFDVAILADVADHCADLLNLLENANLFLRKGGRLCITTMNPAWEPLYKLAELFKMKMPEGEHSFLPNQVLAGFLPLRGFRTIETSARFLIPKRIPLLSDKVNRIAARFNAFHCICAVQTLVAEKVNHYERDFSSPLSCSVIVPCLNEQDNIEQCVSRIPEIGNKTEVIIVDDGSTDETLRIAEQAASSDRRIKVISYGTNKGKGYAVRKGFDAAGCDIVMILDADMTVPPEELPIFFRAIAEGCGEFANGTRMIYPPEKQAMRLLNKIGNFFFGIVLSWLLSQRISDTLCGTKALRRADYGRIHMGNDKWGDFDLLFGAAENGLHIVEVPVHYKSRKAGESKMKPFSHCLLLLGVCFNWFLRSKLRRRHTATAIK
ncbi:MAG: glycosyltransferase [Lentisphaerae bacterium]|nr:glycosyltransferase [Lentisphaerota bacterium]